MTDKIRNEKMTRKNVAAGLSDTLSNPVNLVNPVNIHVVKLFGQQLRYMHSPEDEIVCRSLGAAEFKR
jgi:hypothetical protein